MESSIQRTLSRRVSAGKATGPGVGVFGFLRHQDTTFWLISTQGCPCGTKGNGHVYAFKGYDVEVGIVAGTRALNQNHYYLCHHKSNCLSQLSKKKWKEIKCYLFNNECYFTMPGHEKILNKCII